MLIVLVAVAALLAVPAALNLFLRPDVRRMALRNIARRPVESALVVVGSALGTAIIVAALMVGDTFGHSIRDIARTDLGEIDVTLEFDAAQDLAPALAAVEAANPEALDGILAVRSLELAAAGPDLGPDRRVEPRVSVSALDFAAAARFGTHPDRYGLRGLDGTPTSNQAVINDVLAADLDIGMGDTLSLFAAGAEHDFQIAAVVPADGLGGSADAFVALDRLQEIDPAGAFTFDHVVLSATGGVFDSTAAARPLADRALEVVEAEGLSTDVRMTKDDLLDAAESEADELTQIFSVVGGFSVMAGVLLLVNLFVMLAEERKSSLGVLRAIGWRRAALRRAFRAEGVVYASVASVLGAMLGIAVGWVIVRLTRGILAGANPDSEFRLLLAIEPSSLLTAALVGLIIAMVAISVTSWRISRLNIISAIRDLPEPRTRRSRLVVTCGGAVAVIVGGLLLVVGLSTDNAFFAIASVPLAAAGAALLARDLLAPSVSAGVAGVIAVVWGALFFPLMPASMTTDIDITFFLLFGVVVVAGGVAVTTVLGPVVQRVLTVTSRPMVEARLAMAYPTARLFRTAASLAMYGLIIFTLAFMAVLSNGFSLQTSSIVASTAAGHDLMVESNRAAPIDVDDLLALDSVVAASALLRDGADFAADWDPGGIAESERWGIVGVGPDFATVGAPTLRDRSPRFATDQEALAAVAADAGLVLVPTWFLGSGDGVDPPIGGTLLATTASGTLEFEIVGVTENDYSWSGAWMSGDAARELVPTATAQRIYVAVADGADPDAVAREIETRFLTSGAEAETFDDRVGRFVETDQGFFSLLRGYLLLGLVIGIAGLAVSLFRAVRERRRQIGMVRAMGLPGTGIRRWFMIEAAFISVMGIATGVGLGLLTGYLTTTRSTSLDESTLPFGVPWAVLVLIVAVPLVASVLAAIVPARRAAALRPSEALRLAD